MAQPEKPLKTYLNVVTKTLAQALRQPMSRVVVTGITAWKDPEDVVDEWQRIKDIRKEQEL